MQSQLDTLPGNARVWIYQADRPLNMVEKAEVQAYLSNAISSWSAHGQALLAALEIRYDQVVVLAVDEGQNAASGCSIDASTRWFKSLGTSLNLDFFNRDVALVQGQRLRLFPLMEVKAAVQQGLIQAADLVLENNLPDLQAYRKAWPKVAATTWLNKYFNPVSHG